MMRMMLDTARIGARSLAVLTLCLLFAVPISGMDYIDIRQDGVTHKLWGKVVVEATDGGVMFLGQDGRLWLVQPDEIQVRDKDDRPFTPLTQDEISAQLLDTMPRGFRIHRTANYVICYNTTEAYAEWIGSLYERLYRGFYTYWENRDIELEEPELPLVVLVFADRDSYLRRARADLGGDPGTIIGYFHMLSNFVVMYDLTGTQVGPQGRNPRTSAEINRVLSQPGAESMVATVVHEATHQLACNSGLQARFSETPFWVSEGLAIYFEAPDLRSRRGWRGIGNVNRIRLVQMKEYMRTRPANSLVTLIQDEERFRDPNQLLDAYAEAWALNHYLLARHREKYLEYLRRQIEKKPLVEIGAERRIAEFQECFGEDLGEFDEDFLRYVSRLRN